jgi:hydroxymethylglutaryl-CoA lyase
LAIDITISEVGPRDGLQSIEQIMPTDAKQAWIAAQHAAGFTEIEVGSFVPPKLLPQLADTAEIVSFARTLNGLQVAVLVPNLEGLERAVAAGAHRVMLEELARCATFLDTLTDEQRPVFGVALATAFGCTLEGPIPEDRVVRMAARVVRLGVDEVVLADTTGYGNPAQLKHLATGIWGTCGKDRMTRIHLHNTRGQGLANALMAVEVGFTALDASLGGIGGCPFAPGASGNIVTEDLAWLLESMGLDTGIDLEKLLAARALVQEALPGQPLFGFVAEAGLPKTG